MPPTPVPNLRRAEWLDRIHRHVRDRLSKRKRLRTVKWALTALLTMAAGGLFREVAHLMTERLGWTAPPGRSGERLGAERVPR